MTFKMTFKTTAIILCLAAAGVPAIAGAKAQMPVPTAAHRAAAKKPVDKRANGKKPDEKKSAGNLSPAALASAYAAMPEDERLAIQSDLAWLRHYDGPPGGNFDERTIAAVKAFQQANHAEETGLLDDQQRAQLAAAASRDQQAVGWRLIEDSATGARFGLPDKLVSRAGDLRTGSAWTSGHGQIRIETLRLNEAGLPALFEEEKKTPRGRRIDWSTLGTDSFVISGTQGLKDFVVRAEAKSGQVRGITILYDQATSGIMAPVAIATANSFVGFPNAPSAGQRRPVAYGTAIVADGSGDLVTSRELASGCTAIAVPRFGYAERVAADRTSDLALIRLYGARHLAPAAIAGASAGDDLTLVGIADPLLQNGGDAVTKTAARLDGSLISPVPQVGFSGAAVVDAQGHFVGMVELKSPTVAGGPPAVPQAILVPAATVRAFLTAHGVTAAARTDGAIEDSVLRVICVRN